MKQPRTHFKGVIAVFFICLIAFGGTLWIYRHRTDEVIVPPLPPAKPYTNNKPPQSETPPVAQPSPASASLAEVNLAIPFVSQAPKKNWDAYHEDFCEEASALMVAHYITNKPVTSLDDIDKELFQINDFEQTTFGFSKDTDAAFTARILKEHYHLDKVTLLENPTIDDIKKNLTAGKAILVPVAGRMLKNPHFSGAGPLYHMFVIKGYTSDGHFIANDPGTQFGANYLYSFERIMNAMHDWNDGNVEQGKKVIIIVG